MKSSIVRVFGTTTLAFGLLATTPAVLAQRQNGMGAQQPQTGMGQNNRQPNGPMGMQQNNPQNAFLGHMRRNISVETDLSKMALKNSSDDNVKQFAHQVISENRQNGMSITGAMESASGGMSGLSFGEETPPQTRQAEKQMKKTKGKQFDEMYLSQMNGYIKDDQKTLSDASSSMDSSQIGSVVMQLRNTTDARAKQIAQVAQSANFKLP